MPRGYVTAALWLFGLAAALLFAGDLVVVWLHFPRSPNDGWNAYHALRLLLLGPGALYPAPPSLMFNNYPPLSFVVVAAIARFGGDTLLAGRLLSLFCAPLIALLVTIIARALRAGRRESVVAGLMFLCAPWVLTKFAGVSNPQLFGATLDMMGLLLILRAPPTPRAVIAAALFFTLALFVKLVFVAVPLTVLLWLGFHHRRLLLPYALAGIAFALTGVAASNLLFQTNLLANVISPRSYLPSQIMAAPGQWLVFGFLPLIATLSLFKSDSRAKFCALYAATAFPLALFFCGGAGVAGDPTLDLSIAVTLGSAVFLDRFKPRFYPSLAALFLAAGFAVVAVAGGFSSGPSAFTQWQLRGVADADVAFVARQDGAVLCEMLSFCYWAGKPAGVDTFSMAEIFKRGIRRESELIILLDAHAFAGLQLTPHSALNYSPAVIAAVARNYRLDHEDRFGRFFVKR